MNDSAVERLCRVDEPLTPTAEKGRLMVTACREMALFHRERCPEIARLYERHRFDPETVRAEEDLARLPSLGVAAMKRWLLLSLPEAEACLKLTSSGTRGQKTQVWFDEASLDRVQAMMASLWRQEGLASDTPASYLMLSYDPKDADDLGIAFTNRNLQRFAPAARTFFAIGKDERGSWRFRLEETIATLAEYAAEGDPVRIFGMPAFLWELLDALEGRGRPVMPGGSLVVTGGGWKTAEDRKVSRDRFRERIEATLSIPPENVRDNFGMAEHSAPYIECRQHRFHVPVYNRILVRDPVTMRVVAPGEPGLMELVTPFNAMMPTLAILSTDVGSIDARPCPCGWKTPTFTLIGRGGLSKHKGCALQAQEIIRRGA